jgi:hypothetical protein
VICSLQRKLAATIATLLVATAFGAAAQAEPIDLSFGPVPEQTVLVWPASFLVHEFTSQVAGTVTVSVERVVWADLLSQLSTTVSLEGRPDLQLSGNAQVMFDIMAGERFTTSVYALAAGPRGYGAYSLDISFLPGLTQVPIPAAGWLLLSALGVVALVKPRRRVDRARSADQEFAVHPALVPV